MALAYHLARLIARALALPLFRLEVRGRERIPRSGPFLLAANHASFLDPVLLGAACRRRLFYLMAEPLYRRPAWRWLLRLLGAIPVRSPAADRSAMREARRRLAEGFGVLVFPEGRRSADGRLQPARRGIGLLARQSGAPVLPAAIAGSHDAWPPGRRLPRPRRIRILFGELLPPFSAALDTASPPGATVPLPPAIGEPAAPARAGRGEPAEARRAALAAFTRKVMERIAELRDAAGVPR